MAQNDNWTGGAGSGDAYWDLSTNWNSGVPVSASNAIIGSAYDPEIRTNAGSILTLQDSGGLSIIAGGALNTTSTTVTSFIDGAFSLNGGTLGGSGTTTISGASNWTGGSIGTGSTTGVVDFKGALNITGQTTKFISGDTIDTPNTTIWSGNTGALGNTIYAGDTGTTIINNTGTWKDENTFNAQMLQYSASQFNNSGIYAKSGSSTTDIYLPFNNTGSVTVAAGGTLILSHGGVSTGSFAEASGATLELDGGTHTLTGITVTGPGTFLVAGGSVTQSGMVTDAGALSITGGSLTVNGSWTAASLTESNGILGGSGTTTISGASNWTGGSIGTGSTTGVVDFKGALNITGQTTKFISGDTIDTPNTTIWSGNTGALGNTIYAGDTGTTIINNTGTWKDENTFNAQMLQYSASQFNNSGIYAKSGADTTTISIPFANSGTVDVGTGATLALTGGLSNFSGSTLTGGTYNVSGVLEFPGAKVVTNAASITLAGGASALEDSGGGTNALASFAVNAAAGSFSIQSGRNFTSAGNFTNDGILAVGPGSTFATGGSLTNFAGTTLSGGTYDIGGVLEFPRANIVTNAANIALNGTSAAITNSTTSANGLANFAGNATASSFALTGGANFTTAGAFTNEGTLTVGAGSTFSISGSLTNFSGNTLTAGTYDVTGTLEFPGANIVTNDAGITLSGTAAEIENSTTKKNGLAALATNVDKGTFNLTAGASFTTVGNFSTAGVVSIGTDSTFTVGGTGVFKQTAGTTTDAGTLAASGGVAISSGSLFASGTITGNLASTGIVTPGTSATTTGILTDVGTYTQNAGGRLNIDITGLTAGTQFDVLDATTAVLGGTLNITTKYTPTVGSTFRILSFTSATGTFAAVNGLTINATEAYTVAYQPTDVLLTVVSSGAQTVDPDARLIAASDAADRGRLGEALKAFNADYAEGGRQALAAVNYAILSRQRVTEHIGALARYRAHR